MGRTVVLHGTWSWPIPGMHDDQGVVAQPRGEGHCVGYRRR
jgi:hypothetical protein